MEGNEKCTERCGSSERNIHHFLIFHSARDDESKKIMERFISDTNLILPYVEKELLEEAIRLAYTTGATQALT